MTSADKGKGHLRYGKDYLIVLHEQVVTSEKGKGISRTTFTRYVPDTVEKPKCQDWGASLGKICLNPQLKIEGLQRFLKRRRSAKKLCLPRN